MNEMGDLIKPSYITDTFQKVLKRNGLRKIRFHDFRHSCASMLLRNNVPMKQIQEWLGHSDFSTTANIYAHLDYSSKISSAEILLDFCRMQQCTPSLSQAVRLKAFQQTGKLTEPELIKIISEQKANQKDKLTFRADKFAVYFPKGYTAEQTENFILRMLAERQRKLQKSRDDER